jgi:hypothetical protein
MRVVQEMDEEGEKREESLEKKKERKGAYQKLSKEIELPNWTDSGNEADISSPTSGNFPPLIK